MIQFGGIISGFYCSQDPGGSEWSLERNLLFTNMTLDISWDNISFDNQVQENHRITEFLKLEWAIFHNLLFFKQGQADFFVNGVIQTNFEYVQGYLFWAKSVYYPQSNIVLLLLRQNVMDFDLYILTPVLSLDNTEKNLIPSLFPSIKYIWVKVEK